MTGWGTWPISALAAVVLAAGLLSACGGSDSGTNPASDSGGAPSSTEASQDAGKDAGNSENGNEGSRSERDGGSDGSGGSNPKVEPAPLKVTGGGSAQYRVAGGDNSIQEFGEEGDRSELEEAARALHTFLVARAEERWPVACSYLDATVKDQLDAIASGAGQNGKGCTGILGALTPSLPAAIRNEATIVDAGSLRFEDERAFLIYRGAKGVNYAILMTEEDGWKVASLSATPIS